MHNTKISIIMSCYNEASDRISKSINSILSQTHTNFEFIIALDNPSNKRIDDLLKSYADKDKRIIYIKNKRNYGLSQSLNNLINISSTDYIARMDEDDIAKPTRIEEEIEFLISNNLDLVGSNVEVIDEDDKIMYIYNSAIDEKRLYEEYEIIHPTWFVKKSVYTSLGGIDC